MTVEQMTALGDMARDIIYNPVMYVFIILIFFFVILEGIDHE
jgi:hypothetical protein